MRLAVRFPACEGLATGYCFKMSDIDAAECVTVGHILASEWRAWKGGTM